MDVTTLMCLIFVFIFNRYEDHFPSHPAIIDLNWEHNHHLNTAAVLQFRDVGEKTKDTFMDLFEKGHTPASALELYKSSIQLTSGEDYVYLAADRNVVPDSSSVYKLVFFVNIEFRCLNIKIKGEIKSSNTKTTKRQI